MIKEELETAAQALHYMLFKLGSTTEKLKLVKLAYLADKYHLLHYGRTITRDGFKAMKLGPVGSNVLNILNLNEDFLGQEAVEHVVRLLHVNDRAITARGEIEYDLLSESDKTAIDFAVQKFGSKSASKLVDYLHEFPEWTRHESKLRSNPDSAYRIEDIDIFSVPNGDLAITTEQAEITKEHFLGHF